jgi:hypothetical protein
MKPVNPTKNFLWPFKSLYLYCNLLNMKVLCCPISTCISHKDHKNFKAATSHCYYKGKRRKGKKDDRYSACI